MSELTLRPDPDVGQAGDKLIGVPALTAAAHASTGVRKGLATRGLRRRFSATRLLRADDNGFRPFRVY
jgi:hypothetical protein